MLGLWGRRGRGGEGGHRAMDFNLFSPGVIWHEKCEWRPRKKSTPDGCREGAEDIDARVNYTMPPRVRPTLARESGR